MSDWVSITQAEKELGISRDEIKSKIHNGHIPFRMAGTHFKINIKLTRAYLVKEDIENMNRIKKEISIAPTSHRKTNVRKICV